MINRCISHLYSQYYDIYIGTHKIGPIKRTPGRLPRVPFTAEQLSSLENAYMQSSYLSSEEANRLAASLDLTSTRVSATAENSFVKCRI